MRFYFYIFFSLTLWLLPLSANADLVDINSNLPEECKKALSSEGTWEECAKKTERGSPPYLLAQINLGTQAYMERDFEKAAIHYDESFPEGVSTLSDIFLHTYRADTFLRVGRKEEARRDILIAIEYLKAGRISSYNDAPITEDIAKIVLPTTIVILNNLAMAELEPAIHYYEQLSESDWIDTLNIGAVFIEIGRYEDALPYSLKVLSEQPQNPAALNNHCYLLGLMGNGTEALSYCKEALALSPDDPGLYHSYSIALAADQKCEESADAMAKAHELSPSIVEYFEPPSCQPDSGME